MKKPLLVIMAAGLGSRYGGLKQIDPVDDAGHILIDYAIYDAKRAGFETVIFVITPHIEKEFRKVIGDRIEKHVQVRYAYQLPDTLPAGIDVPEGRQKPWGTAHAVLSAKELVDSSFAAINADDFYGAAAFRLIYDYLVNEADETHYAMVGYQIENTLTEHGHVARGICTIDERGTLLEIVEHTHIEVRQNGAAYTEDGENFNFVPDGTIVSMNMWGFGLSMMDEIESRFAAFLDENLPGNPLKCEYFVPTVVNALIQKNEKKIQVLHTPDKWYGVTYAQDMPIVRKAIAAMKADGRYPELLWEAGTC